MHHGYVTETRVHKRNFPGIPPGNSNIFFLTKNPAQRPQGGDLFLFTHLLVEVSVLFI